MADKIIWHKTEKGKTLIVEVDSDLSQWPDYEEEKKNHHLDYTDEEIADMDKKFRKLRNDELARTDHMMLPDRNPSQELIDYRQALRDAPAHPGWPLELPNITKMSE